MHIYIYIHDNIHAHGHKWDGTKWFQLRYANRIKKKSEVGTSNGQLKVAWNIWKKSGILDWWFMMVYISFIVIIKLSFSLVFLKSFSLALSLSIIIIVAVIVNIIDHDRCHCHGHYHCHCRYKYHSCHHVSLLLYSLYLFIQSICCFGGESCLEFSSNQRLSTSSLCLGICASQLNLSRLKWIQIQPLQELKNAYSVAFVCDASLAPWW